MKLTIGFELELFIVNKSKHLISPALIELPYDGNGMLLELRGAPSISLTEAYYSVFAKLEDVKEKLKNYKILFQEDWFKKDNESLRTQREYLRKFGSQKSIEWENLYNLEPSKKNITHFSAGLHIHFKTEETKYIKDGKDIIYPIIFDYTKKFRALENEFSKEITESGRNRGFYELKLDGRIEYRSLPASIFFKNDFISRLKKCKLL